MKQIGILVIFGITLVSCATPPDVPAFRFLDKVKETKDVEGVGKITVLRPNPKCMKMIGEPVCGYVRWTISDKEAYIGEAKKYWLLGKPLSVHVKESFMVPPASVAKIKAYMVNSCKEMGRCEDVARWRVKLDSLDSVVTSFAK